MALSAGTVWEVRPTNGTTNAGGGFNAAGSSPGTDYSQQNAVQVALGAGGITTSITTNVITFTAGYTAASTDNRNLVAMLTGTNVTAGLYEITSVDTGANTWTMDRNVVTSGTTTNATGNMGGARSGFSVGTTPLQGIMVSGNVVHVKNEAWNEGVNISTGGAGGNPLIIKGYNTARNDITETVSTWANRPVNDRASVGGTAFTFSGGRHRVMYLIAKSSTGTGFYNSAAGVQFIGCRARLNADGFRCDAETNLYRCESDGNSSRGVFNVAIAHAYACYIHDNTSNGWNAASGNRGEILFSIIEANAATGINNADQHHTVFGNTINGNTGVTSDGLLVGTPDVHHQAGIVLNNIFSNNGRDGVRATDGDSVWPDYNDFYGNGGSARTAFPTGASDLALDPTFTDSANGDYSIGTNLKAGGVPGVFPGGLSTGYLDIGAVQRQETGTSAGGVARSRIQAGM